MSNSDIIETFGTNSGHTDANHFHFTDEKIKNLIELNELKKKYNEYMTKKEKILKETQEYDKIVRAREIIKKRVEFNKTWLNILKLATLITHIVLVLIILIMLIYKIY